MNFICINNRTIGYFSPILRWYLPSCLKNEKLLNRCSQMNLLGIEHIVIFHQQVWHLVVLLVSLVSCSLKQFIYISIIAHPSILLTHCTYKYFSKYAFPVFKLAVDLLTWRCVKNFPIASLPLSLIDFLSKWIYKYSLPSLWVSFISNMPPAYCRTLKIANDAPIWACIHFFPFGSKYYIPLNPPTIKSNQATSTIYHLSSGVLSGKRTSWIS